MRTPWSSTLKPPTPSDCRRVEKRPVSNDDHGPRADAASALTVTVASLKHRLTYVPWPTGQAFEKAASIQTSNLKEPDDAANTLTEAYKSYRKDDPEDAARVLEQAIGHYTMKGNFRRAATHKQNLAELYENDLGDLRRAMEAYELAATWFENDNAEA